MGLATLVVTASAAAAGPPTANNVPRFWSSATVIVNPGASIQAAINAARPWTQILVMPGTYSGDLVIAKDGISLVGKNATLVPPAVSANTPCDQAFGATIGVCVEGQTDTQGNVTRPVRNVGVTGFTISGFGGSGIEGYGAQDASFTNNVLANDGGYGAVCFVCSGTWMASNSASGNSEAGLYIGDSPDARATVERNTVWNNQFGVFIRDAEGVTETWNDIRFNCIGTLVAADSPGPAGNVTAMLNHVISNNKVCPASEDSPPVSGVGFALLGANDSTLTQNTVSNNRPGGPTIASGGVVLLSGFGGTPPMNNTITGNFLALNQPDLVWDGTGTGNVLQPNSCSTSNPPGLC
jgi:nitrous oxidase accessory protein NosD